MENHAGKTVLFDFDGTLTDGDTFIGFARHAVGTPRLLAAMVRAFFPLAAWKLGLISGGTAKERLFSKLYRGMDYDVFCRKACRFAATLRGPELNKEVVDILRRHVGAGDEVFVVSASMAEWVAPWAQEHGVDAEHVLTTGIGTDSDGRLTGRFSTSNCAGEEKVRRLAAAGVTTADEAYGNSADDAGMLRIARERYMVTREGTPVRSM